MFSFHSLKPRAPLVSGTLFLLAAACSKDANRVPAGETTASLTPASAGAETTAALVDTPPPAPAETAAAAKPAPVKPRVKPSIDPGRKAPSKPATAATAAAPRDSTTPSASGGGSDQWLKYDAGTNTVTFQLIGGPSGFQFNGYSSGGATLTLPPNAKVVMNFVNKDGTPHSAEVIPGEGPIPNGSGDPAIPRAYTNKALEGLPQEATDVMNFTVPASGAYRIFCGVPGHGLSGMWIWMKIDPAAKTPSFGPTKG
jgi:plastocyanin